MESVGLMMSGCVKPDFWRGKRVFITGHTGFKGGWLTYWLQLMGAKIAGYSLYPNTQPNIFEVLGLSGLIEQSQIADIRDFEALKKSITNFSPDVVIHMAAQPLVRVSYQNPIETYQVNIMGTVHLLEALRSCSSVRSTVIVTTDKCYENHERLQGYSEDEPMGGYDPYSSSKGCAELVTSAYRRSFFGTSNNQNLIASARAGNVIGGGDWSEDRLIPDSIKAFEVGRPIIIRNPNAIRPWQHVLEPLSGYLMLAQALYDGYENYASGWNFGPEDFDCKSVQEVIDLFCFKWGGDVGWQHDFLDNPHEATLLKLDCTKSKSELSWSPKWHLDLALEKIVYWHKAFLAGENMSIVTKKQIEDYQSA